LRHIVAAKVGQESDAAARTIVRIDTAGRRSRVAAASCPARVQQLKVRLYF
jgi:hypothetical protein